MTKPLDTEDEQRVKGGREREREMKPPIFSQKTKISKHMKKSNAKKKLTESCTEHEFIPD